MSILRRGSRARAALFTAGSFAAVLTFTKLGLPKSTPNGILLSGLVVGSLNALVAGGIILVYRSARIINFAQVALGGVGAALTFRLGALLHWPFAAAFLAGLIASVLVGVLVEMAFVRRFFNAPRLVLTVVTVVLASVLSHAAALTDRIPGLPNRRIPGVARVFAEGRIPLPFAGRSILIEPLRFGFAAFLAVGCALAVFAGLALFFRRTRMGRSVRAAAENADRLLLLGVNVRLLSTVVWAGAGLLAGLAAILNGMVFTFSQSGEWAPEVLIPGLAAAVIARMRSMPGAVAAAAAISVVQQSVFWSFPRTTLLDLVLLAVIGVGLLTQRRAAARGDEEAASSWKAVEEIRPTPSELTGVPGVRRARRALVMAAMAAVVLLPLASSPSQTNLASLIAIQAIVAGQVSLGQFAFVAVGAVVGGKLTSDVGIPFWIAVPVTMGLTGGFAALVGLPALRIRGPFLAVTTLAFAVAVQRVLFNEDYFGWLLPDRVERPSLLFLHFSSERNYYYLAVAFAVVAAMHVRRLRASRPGRVLIALREDEPGVQAFGINAARTRLVAFALSGALAGLAGVLFVHHQRAVDAGSYSSEVSVAMFTMAMIGGVTSVSGALLGAAYVGGIEFLISEPLVKMLSRDVGLLLLLLFAPGGLAGIAYAARDAALRIVAVRRRLIVPSLFADVDPEALAQRRQPLAERIPGRGLEALPAERRYAIRSELYPTTASATPVAVPAGGGS